MKIDATWEHREDVPGKPQWVRHAGTFCLVVNQQEGPYNFAANLWRMTGDPNSPAKIERIEHAPTPEAAKKLAESWLPELLQLALAGKELLP